MELSDLLTPESVVAHLKAANKKQALQEIARAAAPLTGLEERAIFDALLERERLGTTGVGLGIAIPHAKMPGLDRLHGLSLGLQRPRLRAE